MTSAQILHIGLDIGSTTVKLVALPSFSSSSSSSAFATPVFKKYQKHLSDIKAAVTSILRDAEPVLRGSTVTIGVTGSGGINVAKSLRVGFVQEVVACTEAVESLAHDADVAIELGGEDAKITYFGDGPKKQKSESSSSSSAAAAAGLEQRMNGTCAGGTGSFIDHMAALLKTDGAGLDALAANHKIIYPIASRCGVFAKTDVQPLLNEGARREDIAASVLQAVVNQTIGGLACGKPIRGKVVFLGGPLHFLPQLRARFVETLHLAPDDSIVPEDAHFFVAIGAALLARTTEPVGWDEFCSRIPGIMDMAREERHLPPMFAAPEDYARFQQRHATHAVPRADLASASGPCFVGIDSGSTTTKVALIDAQGRLLHAHYGPNMGNPLASTTEALLGMYARMPHPAFVAHSCVTGYGEGLVKAALHVDIGEIETLAHFKAADFFLPGVDFVLDIGGQDMKSLRIRNGAIDSIMLNEACSSGCGSFISTFATSLGMPIDEFSRAGVLSAAPVDLGTRCTVFMNSRVKQAQKEGASVADISGGIAISVIKNALFKVIRLRSADEMGEKVVVQGGTFYNDAVLRAFEKISGRNAVRPDIAGIMGAFGAALIARERYNEQFPGAPPATAATTLLPAAAMGAFSCKTATRRCGLCANNCLLTINEFSDGGKFVSGNRCERGAILRPAASGRPSAGAAEASASSGGVPNVYAWKLRRVWKYVPLAPSKAIRGDIGIPRVLSMYEDYPFWHTVFTRLGFRVVLSMPSTKATYELGMETIPSDTVCYPGKLVHGHIEDLIRRGVRKVWLPCVPFNIREDERAHNTYHCPVVGGYSEVARMNIDTHGGQVEIVTPFLPPLQTRASMSHRLPHRLLEELLARRLGEDAGAPPLTLAEVEAAVVAGGEAIDAYRAEVREQGEAALRAMRDRGMRGIVLLGRPYHVDPEVNHGIPEIISSFGFAVLSEDSVAHLGRDLADDDEEAERRPRPLRVVDQWTYHSRLYSAAAYAATRRDLDVLQLVSFGCGLDAVTTDQVKEITEGRGKLYTSLKIDEINNLGAARIRIRSMIAAIRERDHVRRGSDSASAPAALLAAPDADLVPDAVFPADARERGWTALIPLFSGYHMQSLGAAMRAGGYRAVVLTEMTRECIDEGLKYVHNDACFPSICIIGQLLLAMRSGKYDPDRTAVVITQTGGACRATNYVAFLKKALRDSGLRQVPIISVNGEGLSPQPGWQLTPELTMRGLMALLFGDLFMALVLRTRPYEVERGSAMRLYRQFEQEAGRMLVGGGLGAFSAIVRRAIEAFDVLPLTPEGDGLGAGRRPRVGIVGEIMVKLSDDANNHIVEFLESEGAEATTHGLTDFFVYCGCDGIARYHKLAGGFLDMVKSHVLVSTIEAVRSIVGGTLAQSRRFHEPPSIRALATMTERYISVCHQAGEGWFLIGEIISLLSEGVTNVLCLQPFGCLPNHITGRGMVRMLRREFPELNIGAIDYDPGASEINQINRVKLMLTVAKRRLNPLAASSSISFAPSAAGSAGTSGSAATTSPMLSPVGSPPPSFTPGPSGDAPALRLCRTLRRQGNHGAAAAATPRDPAAAAAGADAGDIEDAAGTIGMDAATRSRLCQACAAPCTARIGNAPGIGHGHGHAHPGLTATQVSLARGVAAEKQWRVTRWLLLAAVAGVIAVAQLTRMFSSAAHEVSGTASEAATSAATEATTFLGIAPPRRRRFRFSIKHLWAAIAIAVLIALFFIF